MCGLERVQINQQKKKINHISGYSGSTGNPIKYVMHDKSYEKWFQSDVR